MTIFWYTNGNPPPGSKVMDNAESPEATAMPAPGFMALADVSGVTGVPGGSIEP